MYRDSDTPTRDQAEDFRCRLDAMTRYYQEYVLRLAMEGLLRDLGRPSQAEPAPPPARRLLGRIGARLRTWLAAVRPWGRGRPTSGPGPVIVIDPAVPERSLPPADERGQ